MSRHVFIDNSNIFGGAQRAAVSIEGNHIWKSIRVYYKNLFKLLENGGNVGGRVLAGSLPPGNDSLWDHARKHGYDTDLLRRVPNDNGKLVEQAVDEMLHLKIANTLLDNDAPQTLVIGSGDGAISNWNTSFPGQAERAARLGWQVEVWSWQEQLTTYYTKVAEKYPGRIHVNVLDPYYFSTTFVVGGKYSAKGGSVVLGERVVSPLR